MKDSNDTNGKTVYRIACGAPLALGPPPLRLSVGNCQELTEKYGPGKISRDKSKNPYAMDVSDVVWSMWFRARCAVAETSSHISGMRDRPVQVCVSSAMPRSSTLPQEARAQGISACVTRLRSAQSSLLHSQPAHLRKCARTWRCTATEDGGK